jgi:DNA invertase Pin-like site-specific DNA recombinase
MSPIIGGAHSRRAAPAIGDLQDIVRALKAKGVALKAKGVALKATEQPIDTSTAAGKCFLDMLSVFAEFETNLRKERQMEGILRLRSFRLGIPRRWTCFGPLPPSLTSLTA